MESGQNKTCLSLASLCSREASWLKADRAREFPEVGNTQGFEELFGETDTKLLFPKSGQNLPVMSNLCK